ncbi:MAG: polysaccharide deacetylase family protein [Candidatus Hydrothermarchaeota archaeon]|jgi:peptidoglycan/xylan/chitin deacetylase (PgdA/CDA1 family)|nr:polysaccharide deacetylase family protein [Candidatus Hydrothermarchaeota archaeon]
MKGNRLLIFAALTIFISACISSTTEEEVTLGNWPYGHKSAVTITFETEVPAEEQLAAISGALKERDLNATFFVIAGYFQDNPTTLEELRGFEIANLAWMQRNWKGTPLTPEFQRREISKADAWLRERGYSPRGFRAPFLKSNEATYRILEELGYSYDASQYFAFHPYRTGELLEIPLSLNYDLYWDSLSMSYSMLPTYVVFQESQEKEGLFTFYAHTDKVYKNMNNFTYFLDYVSARNVWLASSGEIADWWLKRENLQLALEGNRVMVTNKGSTPVAGTTIKYKSKKTLKGAVLIKRDKGVAYAVLPEIKPNSQIILEF